MDFLSRDSAMWIMLCDLFNNGNDGETSFHCDIVGYMMHCNLVRKKSHPLGPRKNVLLES